MREKVLKFLNIDHGEQISNVDLLEKLRQFRTKVHPDKNPGLEEIFTEKSAEVNRLIHDFKKIVEDEIKSNSKSITVFNHLEEKEKPLQVFELLSLEDKIESLERELKIKNEENKKLNKKIEDMIEDLEEKKINELKMSFKFSKKDYALISSKVGLSSVILVLFQVSEISNAIKNMINISPSIINVCLMFYIIYCLATYAIKNFISKNIDILFKTIESIDFRVSFSKYMEEKVKFTQSDISDFVATFIEQEYKVLNFFLKVDIHRHKSYIIHLCSELLVKELYRQGIITSAQQIDYVIEYSVNRYKYGYGWESDLKDVF